MFRPRVSPEKPRRGDLFQPGQTCWDDYLQIVFLAINGYGVGSSQFLRGLYERAVTLAYLIQFPAKTERFVKFAAIQEYKALKVALKINSEEELDALMQEKGLSLAQAKQFHDQVKPEFQVTDCEECETTKTAYSWDIDLASMVEKIGEPFTGFFLAAYVIPNFNVHATYSSTNPSRPSKKKMAE
jgi:hypothetical protein